MSEQTTVFTVSKLNSTIRGLLETEMGMLWLVGEISNFSQPSSGHWYFTLKDAQAQVKCAMFKGNNRLVTFLPANGAQVLVRARVTLYEPRGDYQIIVESMQPEGDGFLRQQFEKLKTQLAAEGLFDKQNKVSLPLHPKRIGIITSKTGAALQDILHILKRRDPSLAVIIYPTQVQGKEAAVQIANSIELANQRAECDLLIVGRGGGSLEDLWCFNEEVVVRAMAASVIPTISAVGHETDVTLCDYVADVRASTPSAAAELVSQDRLFKQQQLVAKYAALTRSIEKIVSTQNNKLVEYSHRLDSQHPRTKLQQQAQHLDELERNLMQAITGRMQNEKEQLHRMLSKLELVSPSKNIMLFQAQSQLLLQRLKEAMSNRLLEKKHAVALKMETLHAVSPLATLQRGYSVSLDENNRLLRSITQVQSKQQILTVLEDGHIYSRVERTEKK